jgi:ankyrin repeat protein
LFAISIWGFAESLGDLSHLDETSINPSNSDGKSLLCISCEYDRGKITKEIIARMTALECSIETPSPQGYTALHSASQYGSKAIVQLLLDEGLDVNAYTNEKFSRADDKGPWPPVINLLSGDSGTTFVIQDRVTPLHLASRNGHLEVVKRLLAKSALVDAMSIVEQSTSTFGYVIANEGTIALNYEGGLSALHWAAGKGHEEVVRVLLLAGASVNNRPEADTPALKIGTLMSNGGTVHIQVEGGMNPLSWAIRTRNLRTAALIFKHKERSEIGIDSRETWITLKIDSILHNSGTVHIQSEARVEIDNLLVNGGTSHLQVLEATIAKLVNNKGTTKMDCGRGMIGEIVNSQGTVHIQHRQAVTLKHTLDRANFPALEDYVAKLASGPGSIVPQFQYGLIWNTGTLHIAFPPNEKSKDFES